MVVGHPLRALAGFAPVTPDGDQAREWAERELADPVYAAAEPTALDRIARAVAEFFASLFSAEVPQLWGPWAAVAAAVIVAVVILAAFLVWGVPWATGRARARTELFGAVEERTAEELRRDAAARVARGDWDGAIVLRFRALARGLTERGIVDTPPGATVHAFARAAGGSFPAQADALEAAAAAFDDVRYLRRPGSPPLYERVAALDDALRAAQPAPVEPAGVRA